MFVVWESLASSFPSILSAHPKPILSVLLHHFLSPVCSHSPGLMDSLLLLPRLGSDVRVSGGLRPSSQGPAMPPSRTCSAIPRPSCPAIHHSKQGHLRSRGLEPGLLLFSPTHPLPFWPPAQTWDRTHRVRVSLVTSNAGLEVQGEGNGHHTETSQWGKGVGLQPQGPPGLPVSFQPVHLHPRDRS